MEKTLSYFSDSHELPFWITFVNMSFLWSSKYMDHSILKIKKILVITSHDIRAN